MRWLLLEVEGLRVTYPGGAQAVRGVDLHLGAGAQVGLVGESGCGKTTLVRALIGLIPIGCHVEGRVRFDGRDLLGRGEDGFRSVRGNRIALVPQGAMGALNPVLRIEEQVAETLVAHTGRSWRAARRSVGELLEQVGLEVSVAQRFPHELSGGMCQRVVIAAALAAEPDLVIADEPTTGLDVLVQGTVLAGLTALQEARGFAMLLVSHDVRTVLRLCDRVVVMYGGKVTEDAPSSSLVQAPRHPYSAGLLQSVPALSSGSGDDDGWACVPGSAPDPAAPPKGCAFAARCPERMDVCGRVDPPQVRTSVLAEGGDVVGEERVACHLHDSGVVDIRPDFPVLKRRRRTRSTPEPDLLRIEGLHLTYPVPRRGVAPVEALQDVALSLAPGRVLGLIGQSGSGKSTLARVLLGLEHPQAGSVQVAGVEIVGSQGRTLRHHRRSIGMVRQDPFDALHPGMSIADIVGEPLVVAGCRDLDGPVATALRRAGLDPNPPLLSRRPGQLSGGQRQRVALARALVGEPRLLVADEPTSMLDSSVRGGIADTLLVLRDELDLAILFITHDLAEAAHICDEVIVLLAGRVVERGLIGDVLDSPRHPYTRDLLHAGHSGVVRMVGSDIGLPIRR